MNILLKSPLIFTFFLTLSIANQAVAQTDTSATELNIFPNPNRGTFYITLINKESSLSGLYGMDGRLVKTVYLQKGLNYFSVQSPPGIYILKVGDGETSQQFKVIIK